MHSTAAILIQMIAIALLLRIAWRDMNEQKIANGDVIALAITGATGLVVQALAVGSWSTFLFSLLVGLALFAVLFPFWIWKKLGAGDVKLIAVVPLVIGIQDMLLFSLILLVATLVIVMLIRNPLLLPAPMFQKYLQVYERKGVVPFGVPISVALIGVLLLQISVR
jgi:prepilin peptidase CpaA